MISEYLTARIPGGMEKIGWSLWWVWLPASKIPINEVG